MADPILSRVRTAEEIATTGTILRGVVGSTVHGLAVPGAEDRDEMGVCIEGPEYVVGLHRCLVGVELQPFAQWVYRTQLLGVRSGPGDLDLTIYSLRKYVRMALSGNPTALLLLFVPESALVVQTAYGAELQALGSKIVSQRAGWAFLKYLGNQKRELLGQKPQDVKRPELIAQYGFDTKFAMHALRLGFQGIEVMKTGRISLPMPEESRAFCYGVRMGQWSLPDVVAHIELLEQRLKEAIVWSPLPADPAYEEVSLWLTDVYIRAWRWPVLA